MLVLFQDQHGHKVVHNPATLEYLDKNKIGFPQLMNSLGAVDILVNRAAGSGRWI